MFTKVIVSSLLLVASANGVAGLKFKREPDWFQTKRDIGSDLSGFVNEINSIGSEVASFANEILAALPSEFAAPASSVVTEVTSGVGAGFAEVTGLLGEFIPLSSATPSPISLLPGIINPTFNRITLPATATPTAISGSASSVSPSTYPSNPSKRNVGSDLNSFIANADQLGNEIASIANEVLAILPSEIAAPASSFIAQATADVAKGFSFVTSIVQPLILPTATSTATGSASLSATISPANFAASASSSVSSSASASSNAALAKYSMISTSMPIALTIVIASMLVGALAISL